jgi:hypothetical protein
MTSHIAPRRLAAAAVVLLAVASCGVPGTATLKFEGALIGNVDGPSVTCPAPGQESDAYATWRWQGELDGRAVTVTVGALRTASYPDVLLIDAGAERWGAVPPTSPSLPGRGTLNARIDADGVLHVEADAAPFGDATSDRVRLSGSLRCPKK